MSRCKWCLNSLVSAFVAVAVAGPTAGISREGQAVTPRQTAQRATQGDAGGKSAAMRDTRGSVVVETRALDLVTLQVADFGDLETSAAQ